MKKNEKRNSLAIFEELRLKTPKDLIISPAKEKLNRIDYIYFTYNKKLKKNFFWRKGQLGRIYQVNHYGEPIYSGNRNFQKIIPKHDNLKKVKSNIYILKDNKEKIISFWVKDKKSNFIQVNTKNKKNEPPGIEFEIKSWLRNEAINNVSLTLRNLKKRPYEYTKSKLIELIKEEENKIIKKKGWSALRKAVFLSLGLSWIPFL